MKEKGEAYQRKATYAPIHMPKNTMAGIVIGGFITAFGFAMIWHIWWLAIAGLVGSFVAFVMRAYTKDVDYYVQPDEVARVENEFLDNAAKG